MDGRLRLGPDGRLLLLRPPLPGEADRLRRLDGLAVPAVVDEVDGELLVTWAPPLAVPVAEVAAWVAEVLADAHDRGVGHGPLVVDHVRTGSLDGWAGGDRADDVAGFGRLVLDADPAPPPAVLAVARRCVAADPAARPTMRAVAAALAAPAARRRSAPEARTAPAASDRAVTVPAADPAASEPAGSDPAAFVPAGARRREVPAWVPAAVAVPVAVAAVVLASGGAPPAEPRRAAPVVSTTTTPPTTPVAAPYEPTVGGEPYEGVSPP